MAVQRSRKKLTTTLSNVDTRIRHLEMRPYGTILDPNAISYLSGGVVDMINTPISTVGPNAPSTYKRIIDAKYFASNIVGTVDRVEIYTDAPAGVLPGGKVNVYGVHGDYTDVSGNGTSALTVVDIDTIWSNGLETVGSGVNVFSYSVGNTAFSAYPHILATKNQITFYEATVSEATLTLQDVVYFQVDDVISVVGIDVDFDGVFLVTAVDTVAKTIKYAFANPLAASVPSTAAPLSPAYVYPTMHEYANIGDTWIDNATNPPTVYVWDGFQWVDSSKGVIVKPDGVAPAAPTGTSASYARFFDTNANTYRDGITVTWTAPTLNSDGTTLKDLRGYTIYYKYRITDSWAQATFLGDATTQLLSIPPVNATGLDMYIAVSAYDSGGILSEKSNTYNLVVDPLTAGVLPPSKPLVSSRMGAVIVTWDGKDYLGAAEGPALSYMEVHKGLSTGFTPDLATTFVGTFPASTNYSGGFLSVNDLTYGTTYYFKLIAVDITGGRTDPSAASDGIAAQALVNTDIIANTLSTWPFLNGTVDANALANGSVSAAKLTDNAVTASALSANAVTSAKIAANAVQAGMIAVNAITSDVIAAAAITSGKIAANAVDSNAIAAAAITNTKIAANAVTANSIQANAITAIKLDANAVTANVIAANAITAYAIAANAVTANSIAANAVTANSIAANAVTAYAIAANAVTANAIIANAIGADQIAANAITSAKISANAIGADQIAAGAIIAGKIGANAVTASTVEANAITAGKIQANALDAMTLTGTTIRTAATYPKVEMNSNGIKAYDASNNVTFNLSSSGSLTIGITPSITGYATNSNVSTVGSIANNAYGQANTAYGQANTAYTAANTANSGLVTLAGNVYYPGTTQINGGNIYTGTITSGMITASGLIGVPVKSTSTGQRVEINSDRLTFYSVFGDSYGGDIKSSVYGINIDVFSSTTTAAFLTNGFQFAGGTTTISGGIDATGTVTINSTLTNLWSTTVNVSGLLKVDTGAAPTGTSGWDTTTNAGYTYIGGGTIRANSGGTLLALSRSTTGNVGQWQYLTTVVGSISISTTATSYNTSSDYRLKENIVPISNSLSRLSSLKPSRFNFIADKDTIVDGFIAHEVSEIVPEAVHGAKDAVDSDGNPEYQGIDQSKLVPLIVGAIQELSKKVDNIYNILGINQ